MYLNIKCVLENTIIAIYKQKQIVTKYIQII